MANSAPPIPTDLKKTSMPAPPAPNPVPKAATAPAGGPPVLPSVLPTAAVAQLPPEAEMVVPMTFWQHPFVQNVLPFLTSLVLHIGLIVLGLIFAKAAAAILAPAAREQLVIPDADMVAQGPEGGIPHPGLGGDETRDAAQDKFLEVPKDSKGLAEKPGPSLQVALAGGGETGDAQVIGIGAGGFGKGAQVGGGDGDGTGQLAPFGVPGGGGGIGPKSNFFGTGTSAKRIVYVCDASGTMLTFFDTLRVELEKSVDNLKPIQSFNVVIFQDDSAVVFNQGALAPGNPDQKRKLKDFIEKQSAHGHTNPMPAIRAAFQLQPELMYVLTDGFDAVDSLEAVVEEFRKLNKDKKVKVITILVGSKEQVELVNTLKKIASENGGKMKIVDESGNEK